jgi:hypothetical protein
MNWLRRAIVVLMRRARKQLPRNKRLNLCLSEPEYQELVRIAERERRDVGFVASSLVESGIKKYKSVGSLVSLWESEEHD